MFEDLTVEGVKGEILSGIAARYPKLSTDEGGFLDSMAGPVAAALWKYAQSLNAVVPIAHVDESSGGYLDLRAEEFGLEARKAGTRAKLTVSLTGTAGTALPKGTMFLTGDGLGFALEEAVRLGDDGTAQGTARAEDVGTVYNVEAGRLVRMYVNVPGLASFTGSAAEGGTDPESDGALYARLAARMRRPPTSGNGYHYEQWALEIPGIGAVRVVPLWNGPGTVKVLVVGPDREPVPQETVALCAGHIEAERPIGAAVTVASAQGLAVDVAATVVLDGAAGADEVQTRLAAKLDAYLKEVAFRAYTLRYNQVAYLLLSVEGVADYTALTVNGGTANVTVGPDQVPVLGAVRVSV